MDPACAFVKSVNTIYCAFVLGQSQDVDNLWVWGRWEADFRPPQMHRQWRGDAFFFPQVGEEEEVTPARSKRGATAGE